MNREIKFRGLRTDGKGWLFGDLADFSTFICVFPTDADWHDIVQSDRRISPEYEVKPETVGQLLGRIKDQEVYEGDIITNPKGRIHEVVVWDNIPSLKYTQRGQVFYSPMTQGFLANKTIIGNIHQNPELLKSHNTNTNGK